MESNFDSNFRKLIARISQIGLDRTAGQPLPATLAECRQAVAAGAQMLPPIYGPAYAQPLQNKLELLYEQAKTPVPDLVEALTGAVYQHQPTSPMRAPLNRFLAVISDLYQSFLDKQKRQQANIPVDGVLPPLGMFMHSAQSGPFTITAEKVKGLIGGSVGVVSLPAAYAADPVVWGSLAHETGGHDVTHADSGLLEELAENTGAAFAGMASDASIPASQLTLLWGHWMDEASADVYALLNMGPAYAMNLAAFFAALLTKGPYGTVRSQSGSDAQGVLDPHPTDILRPYLAIGAIEALTSLSAGAKSMYTQQIERIVALLAPAQDVQILGHIPLNENSATEIRARIPMAYAAGTARRAGRYIATHKLHALNGRSIQDIETWDDGDEAHAQKIKSNMIAQQSVAGMGDDAQLLAGATLALLEQPELYDSVTSGLSDGLDESFRADPVWSTAPGNTVGV